jgi:hypothetical protein
LIRIMAEGDDEALVASVVEEIAVAIAAVGMAAEPATG